MRVVTAAQLTLSLEPGLLQRYKTLRDCLHHSCLNDPRGLKAIAADCDLSASELSRRLNPSPGDPRSLDVDVFVDIMASTDDYMPLRWLIARFLPDDTQRQAVAVQKLERLMSEVASVLHEVKGAADTHDEQELPRRDGRR
jgi:hypothetical protein